ncbi:MAG: alanine racemase [Acidimicrobiaceae bacterium]|nr:alanine racemase [Acidimicrobiaceae bacterium]
MIRARSRPAWAEIDADALVANAQLMKSIIWPSQLCAVVKADGYGHGAVIVSKILEENGVDQFAVAHVDEAIELRQAGIVSPILCLAEPSYGAFADALENQVTLTLYTKKALDVLAQNARNLYEMGVLADPNPSYQLKIDTGMHRVGANPKDIREIAEHSRQIGLNLGGFWTHMAVADDPENPVHDEFTKFQIGLFEKSMSQLLADGFTPKFHVANSATGVNYPEARYDMVRSGIALYGCPPSPNTQIAGLRQVISLKSRVVHVRTVGSGERPSYGRIRPTVGEKTVLACVPLGYADGVPRALFDAGAQVLIGGKRRPLAGTVTMDQVIVDCGSDFSVSIGDEVVFLGSQGSETITPNDWASMLGTINYEVITGIGFRVPRILAADVNEVIGSRPTEAEHELG